VPRRTDRRALQGDLGFVDSPVAVRGSRNSLCCGVAQHHFLQGLVGLAAALASSGGRRRLGRNKADPSLPGRDFARSFHRSNRGTTNKLGATVYRSTRPASFASSITPSRSENRMGTSRSRNCGRFRAPNSRLQPLQHADKNREGLAVPGFQAGGWRQQGPAGLEFRPRAR